MRESRRFPTWPWLLLAAVAVMLLALQMGRPPEGEEGFGGTDAAATEQIDAGHPGYTPWAESLFTPAGGEIESGLFALQAALGAGALGFVLGTLRERSRQRRAAAEATGTPHPGRAPGADAAR